MDKLFNRKSAKLNNISEEEKDESAEKIDESIKKLRIDIDAVLK